MGSLIKDGCLAPMCAWSAATAVTVEDVSAGEEGNSQAVERDFSPRGVQSLFSEVGVAASWTLDGEGLRGSAIFVGDNVGVVGRMAADGEDGDSGRRKCAAGESGRRNGEVRGEPKERGDGL